MIKRIAKILRKRPTDAERYLWTMLRRKQIHSYKFRRQVPIGNYVVDFACMNKRLVIELDGGQHARQEEYDTLRDAWLQEQGFQVIRFWNNQVFKETEAVLRCIEEALLSADNPPPQPAPARGEGE